MFDSTCSMYVHLHSVRRLELCPGQARQVAGFLAADVLVDRNLDPLRSETTGFGTEGQEEVACAMSCHFFLVFEIKLKGQHQAS